jgi:hypothetical protein
MMSFRKRIMVVLGVGVVVIVLQMFSISILNFQPRPPPIALLPQEMGWARGKAREGHGVTMEQIPEHVSEGEGGGGELFHSGYSVLGHVCSSPLVA